MSLWWLGVALAGPPTEGPESHTTHHDEVSDGHAHRPGCPAAPLLAKTVGQRPLSETERRCITEAPLGSPQGTALAWVGLVDDVRHRQREPSDEVVAALRAHTPNPASALVAAAQLEDFPEWRSEALQAARRSLAAQAWSVGWSRSHAALETLSDDAVTDVVPRAPAPSDLAVCRDVGRLQARALFGGVYSVERDCAVRAAEAAEGEERRAWARLSWAMTLQHPQADEEVWVSQRLGELGLDPAAL